MASVMPSPLPVRAASAPRVEATDGGQVDSIQGARLTPRARAELNRAFPDQRLPSSGASPALSTISDLLRRRIIGKCIDQEHKTHVYDVYGGGHAEADLFERVINGQRVRIASLHYISPTITAKDLLSRPPFGVTSCTHKPTECTCVRNTLGGNGGNQHVFISRHALYYQSPEEIATLLTENTFPGVIGNARGYKWIHPSPKYIAIWYSGVGYSGKWKLGDQEVMSWERHYDQCPEGRQIGSVTYHVGGKTWLQRGMDWLAFGAYDVGDGARLVWSHSRLDDSPLVVTTFVMAPTTVIAQLTDFGDPVTAAYAASCLGFPRGASRLSYIKLDLPASVWDVVDRASGQLPDAPTVLVDQPAFNQAVVAISGKLRDSSTFQFCTSQVRNYVDPNTPGELAARVIVDTSIAAFTAGMVDQACGLARMAGCNPTFQGYNRLLQMQHWWWPILVAFVAILPIVLSGAAPAATLLLVVPGATAAAALIKQLARCVSAYAPFLRRMDPQPANLFWAGGFQRAVHWFQRWWLVTTCWLQRVVHGRGFVPGEVVAPDFCVRDHGVLTPPAPHPTSRLDYYEDGACTPRPGCQLLGLGVCNAIPVCARRCIHNDRSAIEKRILADALDHSDLGDNGRSIWFLRQFVETYPAAPLPFVDGPILAQWLAINAMAALVLRPDDWSPPDLRALFPAWNARFPKSRRTYNERGLRMVESTPPTHTWRVRKIGDRSLAVDYDDQSVTEAFPKRELLFREEVAYCPRLIQQASPTIQVEGGVVFWSLSKAIAHDVLNGQVDLIRRLRRVSDTKPQQWAGMVLPDEEVYITYVSGMSGLDIGEAVAAAAQRYQRPNFISSDFSRFDATQRTAALLNLWLIYSALGVPVSLLDRLIGWFVTRGKTASGLRYYTLGVRRSGYPDTSLGNSINNGIAWLYAAVKLRIAMSVFILGDDAFVVLDATAYDRSLLIPAVMRELGFEIKLVHSPSVFGANFLTGRFYPVVAAGNHTLALGPFIFRVLAKTFWKTGVLVARKEAWVRCVALSLLTRGVYIPVLRDLLPRVLELTAGAVVTPGIKTMVYVDPAEKGLRQGQTAVFDELRGEEFTQYAYGFSYSQLLDLERLLRATPCLPVRVLHPCLESMACADAEIPTRDYLGMANALIAGLYTLLAFWSGLGFIAWRGLMHKAALYANRGIARYAWTVFLVCTTIVEEAVCFWSLRCGLMTAGLELVCALSTHQPWAVVVFKLFIHAALCSLRAYAPLEFTMFAHLTYNLAVVSA